MALPRLFLDAPLASGAALAVSEAQARYLATVLRLGVGAELRVFNGVDGEWRAEITATTKKGVVLTLVAMTRPQIFPPDLMLLFAPVKRHGTDLLVEKATELGVRILQPVITRRTNAEKVRTDRLRSIVIEAAEQTERLDLPDVREPLALGKALDGWDASRRILFADEEGDALPVPPALAGLGFDNREKGPAEAGGTQKLAFLTGPEGGFDPEERRLLRALPFVTPVSLGPRILRAETAVIAGLALIQATWGDWVGTGPERDS